MVDGERNRLRLDAIQSSLRRWVAWFQSHPASVFSEATLQGVFYADLRSALEREGLHLAETGGAAYPWETDRAVEVLHMETHLKSYGFPDVRDIKGSEIDIDGAYIIGPRRILKVDLVSTKDPNPHEMQAG